MKKNEINNIQYSTNKNEIDGFRWLVEEDSLTYYFTTTSNYSIKNFSKDKYYKKLLADDTFSSYNYDNKFYNFKNISIGEYLLESNFSFDHKYSYDLNIESGGKVIANVYFPENKIGGYSFNISLSDLNILKGILGNISFDISGNYYTDNELSSRALIIDDKYIFNDFNKIKSNVDINALLMFSNYITIKYINNKKPNDLIYNIKTSEYLMRPEKE